MALVNTLAVPWSVVAAARPPNPSHHALPGSFRQVTLRVKTMAQVRRAGGWWVITPGYVPERGGERQPLRAAPEALLTAGRGFIRPVIGDQPGGRVSAREQPGNRAAAYGRSR
jgi:hypothetical protein